MRKLDTHFPAAFKTENPSVAGKVKPSPKKSKDSFINHLGEILPFIPGIQQIEIPKKGVKIKSAEKLSTVKTRTEKVKEISKFQNIHPNVGQKEIHGGVKRIPPLGGIAPFIGKVPKSGKLKKILPLRGPDLIKPKNKRTTDLFRFRSEARIYLSQLTEGQSSKKALFWREVKISKTDGNLGNLGFLLKEENFKVQSKKLKERIFSKLRNSEGDLKPNLNGEVKSTPTAAFSAGIPSKINPKLKEKLSSYLKNEDYVFHNLVTENNKSYDLPKETLKIFKTLKTVDYSTPSKVFSLKIPLDEGTVVKIKFVRDSFYAKITTSPERASILVQNLQTLTQQIASLGFASTMVKVQASYFGGANFGSSSDGKGSQHGNNKHKNVEKPRASDTDNSGSFSSFSFYL